MPTLLDHEQAIEMRASTGVDVTKLVKGPQECAKMTDDVLTPRIVFRDRCGGKDQHQRRRRKHLGCLHIHLSAAEMLFEQRDKGGHLTSRRNTSLPGVSMASSLCRLRLVVL